MGFIFGLMIGSMAASGGAALPPMLGTIPFRCLAAFEESEVAYKNCRWISLRSEVRQECTSQDMANQKNPCSLENAIAWEIAGLKELKRATEQKRTDVR